MRDTASSNGLTALAVAGTNVVMLGWDMPASQIQTENVLGFSIGRQRASDGEMRWMTGMKTLQSVEPNPAPGCGQLAQASFQTFQWADYSVPPGKHLPDCGRRALPRRQTARWTATVTTEAV
jgi:hypothetical protein